MTTIYHARDEDALRNGTYIVQSRGKHNSTYGRYILGDFHGWLQLIPADEAKCYKPFTAKEAKAVRRSK